MEFGNDPVLSHDWSKHNEYMAVMTMQSNSKWGCGEMSRMRYSPYPLPHFCVSPPLHHHTVYMPHSQSDTMQNFILPSSTGSHSQQTNGLAPMMPSSSNFVPPSQQLQYDYQDYSIGEAGGGQPCSSTHLLSSQNGSDSYNEGIALGYYQTVDGSQPLASGSQPVASDSRTLMSSSQPVASGCQSLMSDNQPVASGSRSLVSGSQPAVSVIQVAPSTNMATHNGTTDDYTGQMTGERMSIIRNTGMPQWLGSTSSLPSMSDQSPMISHAVCNAEDLMNSMRSGEQGLFDALGNFEPNDNVEQIQQNIGSLPTVSLSDIDEILAGYHREPLGRRSNRPNRSTAETITNDNSDDDDVIFISEIPARGNANATASVTGHIQGHAGQSRASATASEASGYLSVGHDDGEGIAARQQSLTASSSRLQGEFFNGEQTSVFPGVRQDSAADDEFPFHYAGCGLSKEEVPLGITSYRMTKKKLVKDASCSICLDDFVVGRIISVLPCKHEFHAMCVKGWLKKNSTCPNCRQIVVWP